MPEKTHAPAPLHTAVDPAHVLSETRLLAEKHQAWDGIYVAYAHFPPGEFALPPIHGPLVTLHLGSPVATVRKRDGRVHEATKVQGDIEIVSPGCPSYWAYESADEAIGIMLAPEFVQQVAAQAAHIPPERVDIPNNFGTRDPLIAHLGLALFAELKEDNIAGRLFAESAAQLLAVHLLRKYATDTHSVREYPGGLPRHKLRRVLEFIDAQLENDVTLAELAATVGLSSYHFARLFKQSTGLPPYQYVIERRIDAAKTLLTRTELAIATIAYRVGFASQSHFTTHFRHRTGVTPKAYRDMR